MSNPHPNPGGGVGGGWEGGGVGGGGGDCIDWCITSSKEVDQHKAHTKNMATNNYPACAYTAGVMRSVVVSIMVYIVYKKKFKLLKY